jgi:hypothetical protein
MKTRTLDGVEQQIQDTCSAVSIDFLMKSAESVSSMLQKCVQNAGASVEI